MFFSLLALSAGVGHWLLALRWSHCRNATQLFDSIGVSYSNNRLASRVTKAKRAPTKILSAYHVCSMDNETNGIADM